MNAGTIQSWAEFRALSKDEQRRYLECVDLRTFYARHPEELARDRAARD